LARVHVGVPVPELAAHLVREVAVDRRAVRLPHPPAVLVPEELPGLDQVLVVGVDAAAEVGLALGPLAGADVDRGAHEADLRPPLVDGHEGFLRLFVIGRLAGEPRERPELEEERSRLCRVGDRLADGAGLQVHVGPREAGGGVEGLQQPAPEVVGEGQELRIACELVAGEEAAQQPDRDLERLHRHVLVEGGVRDDVGVVLLRLVLEPQQDQGVEGVDRRREERLAVPVPRGLRERPQLVVAPGMPLVAPPRVEELHLHLGGEGGAVEGRGGAGRP
jgi:hypothetical protein